MSHSRGRSKLRIYFDCSRVYFSRVTFENSRIYESPKCLPLLVLLCQLSCCRTHCRAFLMSSFSRSCQSIRRDDTRSCGLGGACSGGARCRHLMWFRFKFKFQVHAGAVTQTRSDKSRALLKLNESRGITAPQGGQASGWFASVIHSSVSCYHHETSTRLNFTGFSTMETCSRHRNGLCERSVGTEYC